ncbi:hypothetical protein [Synechococcus sp. 1G10]|nr:hypothetical protein [Synechococcus sp. 1G10]
MFWTHEEALGMWGDEPQLKVVRERMKLLLDIHYDELAPVLRQARAD